MPRTRPRPSLTHTNTLRTHPCGRVTSADRLPGGEGDIFHAPVPGLVSENEPGQFPAPADIAPHAASGMVTTPSSVTGTKRKKRFSPGAFALNMGLLVVTGFAIAALAGVVSPITAAFVGLGAQVVGTVAFFLTYVFGKKEG